MLSFSLTTFLLLLSNSIFDAVCESNKTRYEVVPVVHCRGTHYEVGYIIGTTFSTMIKSFVASYENLRTFEREYKTEAGQNAYELTLANVRERFPQYVHEIEGVAEGSGVPFYQLFLLHMDDLIETINGSGEQRADSGGCTSIAINSNKAFLGHTEDAFSATVNHFYIVSAHIIPTEEDRKCGAREERFSSLSYAGQLPGYTSGFNQHGLVHSINTLSPLQLKPGNTPRTFLARAVLSSYNISDAVAILTDEGMGAGNGFSINMMWTDHSGRTLHNAEVAPDYDASRSRVNLREFVDEPLIHVNIYDRIKVREVKGPIVDSSEARLKAIARHPTPRSRTDIKDIISDTNGDEYRIFEARPDAVVQTICAGIFDIDRRTWSIYITPPNKSEPVAVLPIQFNCLSS